jgi:hypothetical protein
LRIAPLDQPDVDVEAGAGGELGEERRYDVAREAAHPLAGEVDVRDAERPVRDLERSGCERLVRGQ